MLARPTWRSPIELPLHTDLNIVLYYLNPGGINSRRLLCWSCKPWTLVVSPKSGILHIFSTSHLAADTDPTTVEIRLRDLIIIERRGYSRFFELPIAVIARLSFENETNPCDTKRY